jgi:predicted ribosome quality control (RQC) complex YloA/Tae2 family protein
MSTQYFNKNEAESELPSKDAAGRKNALQRQIRHMLKREKGTLEKQSAECVEAEKWVWYRQIADSILSSPTEYPRGTGECCVKNNHSGKIELVRLNVKCDAFENSQILYKKAKKGERGHKTAVEKRGNTEKMIQTLESIANDIDALDTGAETFESVIAEIEARAGRLGIAVQGQKPHVESAKDKSPAVPYRHFVIDGYDVYAGKTDAQNDELTTRFARPSDIWMHVAQHAGSHLIIRKNRTAPEPPHDVIAKAAAITAWFSKARHAAGVEVHVCEKRFVYKPHKAKPGSVCVQRCKSIRVAPKSPRDILPPSDQKAVALENDAESGDWE